MMAPPLGLLLLPCLVGHLRAAPHQEFSDHLNTLHQLMTDEEKEFYFGGESPTVENYEVTDVLQPEVEEGQVHKNVHFEAMGQSFRLTLVPNSDLLAPQAVVLKRTHENNLTDLVGLDTGHKDNCHFLHKDEDTVAALSICSGSDVQGLVLGPSGSFEIMPLTHRLKRMDTSFWTKNETMQTSRESKSLFDKRNLHLVKRNSGNGDRHRTKEWPPAVNVENDDVAFDKNARRKEKRSGKKKVLETAVFLDAAAYRKFSNYFRNMGRPDTETEVRRLLLSYLNGIQAIYMLPSLTGDIKFSIVRIEMNTDGYDQFNNHNGDREPLLNAFCDYQMGANFKADSDPGHWDMALLVSGLNFYAVDSYGRKNGVTMGLARVGGVCHIQHNCVIGELGVTNDRGKPYPSAGFTAVYVMAHEIGHNLGMHHDHTATPKACDKDGFIMSASRGTFGETKWSDCSVKAIQKAEAAGRLVCLEEDSGNQVETLGLEAKVLPGEVWSATRQCTIFLLDSDARIDHTKDTFAEMCEGLRCRTPNRMKAYYRAGPALEGTACGSDSWCRGGACVSRPPEVAPNPQPGTWSDWKTGDCESGCTSSEAGHSLGFKIKKRDCTHPTNRIHSTEGCQGRTSSMEFCDDTAVCGGGRQDISTYASEQCKIFDKYVGSKILTGQGTQASHSKDRLWMGCAIFCKVEGAGWYTPRLDLNDLPLSPYFPTGTLCHHDPAEGVNYYCQKNMCVEEKQRVGRDGDPDLNLLFNAPVEPSGEAEPPAKLEQYFSLDENLNAVGGEFSGLSGITDDDTVEDIDYVEIPTKR